MRFRCCLGALLLAGCQSLTGLTGSSATFACKAPDGIACSSVSGVHANFMAHNLPFQRRGDVNATTVPAPTGFPLAPPAAGDPLRKDPRILRIWIAPWVDDEGTLHDQSFLYTQVDEGRWLIGEYRRQLKAPPPRANKQPDVAAARTTAPAATQMVRPPPDKPLADVRSNLRAQESARQAVDAAQRPGERP